MNAIVARGFGFESMQRFTRLAEGEMSLPLHSKLLVLTAHTLA
ncbi:hypothetical protein WMF20_09435 [Sorangium sp. So ce834]